MLDADWAGLKTPLNLTRNLTITGPSNIPAEWPLLDLSFTEGKVRLGPGVVLTMARLVVTHWLAAPHFQAPGYDLLAPSAAPPSPAAGKDYTWPVLRLMDGAAVQRTCHPSVAVSNASTATAPRHPVAPGPQVALYDLPQPGCVNGSAAAVHATERCWPSVGVYQDVVTYGTKLDQYGKAVSANYVLWLSRVRYLAVGCFYNIYPRQQQPPQQQQQQQPQPTHSPAPAPPLPQVAAASGDDGTGHDNGSRHILGPALGGSLGGVAGLAAVCGGVLFAFSRSAKWRRYRRKHESAGSLGMGAVAPEAVEGGQGGAPSAAAPHLPCQAAAATAAATKPSSRLLLVTPLTPLLPGLMVDVRLGSGADEVQLLPSVTLGRGACGRVVEGVYGGVRVAVKLLEAQWALQGAADDGVIDGAVGPTGHATAAAEGSGGSGLAAAVAAAAAQPFATAASPTEEAAGADVAASAAGPAPSDPVVGAGPAPSDPVAGAGPAPSDRVAGAGPAGRATDPSTSGCSAAEPLQSQPFPTEATIGSTGAAGGSGTGGGGGSETWGGGSETGAAEVLGAAAEAEGAGGRGLRARGLDVQATLAQEVEVLGRCDHPNVVRLLAASTKPPTLFLVMELMDTSLDRLLYGNDGGQRPLPLPTVLHIAIQVAQALAYLHPTIMHRDLKPGNVLISRPDSPEPTAKLADFGLSRLRATVLVTQHPEAGTRVAHVADQCA
ncbi:hypothetical protein GPECTOR_407g246 [Gonium pectorale]|uniref:Protein kinase domain-containing protein n=1 Tax=Gonium pectorale TaxID=33097 RepID=A0A150FVD5_GONPE|nr:hypothetical protein GPECTOR_407g246 [Gonium pectorale]|eukprot:KXZ41538.1 hypothetical protein GPECTOR_407g246 [Gonium pectorale]